MAEHDGPADRPDEPPVDELAEEASAHNEDPVTQREALELDLEDRGRSEEGAEVGDEMP